MPWINKNTGQPVVGTLQAMQGIAFVIMEKVEDPRDEDNLPYAGETEIWWDSQYTELNNEGWIIWIDDSGALCNETEVVRKANPESMGVYRYWTTVGEAEKFADALIAWHGGQTSPSYKVAAALRVCTQFYWGDFENSNCPKLTVRDIGDACAELEPLKFEMGSTWDTLAQWNDDLQQDYF